MARRPSGYDLGCGAQSSPSSGSARKTAAVRVISASKSASRVEVIEADVSQRKVIQHPSRRLSRLPGSTSAGTKPSDDVTRRPCAPKPAGNVTLEDMPGVSVARRTCGPSSSVTSTARGPARTSSVNGRGELVSLRGELMPVFRLHQLFEVHDAVEDPTRGLLMIIADGRRRCALLVDELLGQQQVVTKTLGQGVGKIPGVSGGAILGDGCVGLILDTAEIVALARQNTSAYDRKEEPVKLQAA